MQTSTAPVWFSMAHSENPPSLDDARTAYESGELSRAERLYVGTLEALSMGRREGGTGEAAGRLREIYEALGWEFHARATERISG